LNRQGRQERQGYSLKFKKQFPGSQPVIQSFLGVPGSNEYDFEQPKPSRNVF
jgi:hypothetical protein